MQGKRHGHGACLFADGVRFTGRWEVDEWVQSAAEPARCRASGKGLCRALAGQVAEFTIEVRARGVGAGWWGWPCERARRGMASAGEAGAVCCASGCWLGQDMH